MSPPSHSGHRPNVIDPPPDKDYQEIASDVDYVCHPAHKTYPLPGQGGWGGSRPKASRTSFCPTEFKGEEDQLAEWVAEAIRKKAVSRNFSGDYPDEIWYKADDGTVYKGRISNPGQGEYHGFPISEDEWPQEIEEIYG
ncbi:hypothetical protein [Salinibacter ruber]|uniref:hypothetical protein n=1 Tax=Salinibacter ruber TaxID=146919 RepID=UPI002074824E|nr:hypothetical protein [Salinibacter ruber]